MLPVGQWTGRTIRQSTRRSIGEAVLPFTAPNFTIIIHIALAAIVYHDSRLNGRSGIGWAFVVFLTGVWGFIAYILLSRDTLKLAAIRFKRKSLKERLTSPTYKPREDRPDRSGHALPPEIKIEPPTDSFIDHQLESLIDEGKLPAARKHLDNVLKVAKELGDEETIGTYERYEQKLNELEQPGGERLISI